MSELKAGTPVKSLGTMNTEEGTLEPGQKGFVVEPYAPEDFEGIYRVLYPGVGIRNQPVGKEFMIDAEALPLEEVTVKAPNVGVFDKMKDHYGEVFVVDQIDVEVDWMAADKAKLKDEVSFEGYLLEHEGDSDKRVTVTVKDFSTAEVVVLQPREV